MKKEQFQITGARKDILDHLENHAEILGRLTWAPTEDADWLAMVRRKRLVYIKAILTLEKEWEREREER